MYAGIIQEVGTITNMVKRANTHGISIRASSDFLTDLHVGNSISVDGVCHTVTDDLDALTPANWNPAS
jgi:riboflavin synthase alpha subunit